MAQFVAHRYRTADPFQIAKRLGIEVRWEPLDEGTLGSTQYICGCPIVILSDTLRDSPQRYFVMAHELGHVILHADVAGFYKTAFHGDSKAEHEADAFATELMLCLYSEDHQQLPSEYGDLVMEYGVPGL